ncbi:histidine kinase [Empedobacter brevis]|uniref:histidine kinase n=1 Tax=Empedobacter brevis TaxID=247 RepID=UPI0039AEB3F4
MDSYNKPLIIIFSVLTSLILFIYVLSEGESIFPISSSFELGLFVEHSIKFIALGFVIYKFTKGIIVSDKKLILRNIFILFIVNVLIYSVIFFTSPNVSFYQYFHPEALKYFVGYFSFSIAASFVNTSVFNEYRTDFPESSKPENIIGKYFLRSIFYTMVLYYVFVKFANLLLQKYIFYDHTINYLLVAIVTVFFLFIFYIIDRKKNKLEHKIVLESTKAETATAQFETLKNQLDPHFLFNSLNVLTGLIEENPENAIDFTTSLSKIYRYVLEQKDKEVVSIQEEINFAKTYVNLLKLRFENSIDFEIEPTTFTETEFIVPLSLQILLENTIKHNIVSEQKPLKIKIYKKDNFLIIENSFQPKETIKDSTGIGLKNIINRYQLISNREVNIKKSEEFFRVELPILTQKNTVMNTQNIDEEKAYQRAIERAKELKKFYTHLGTYLVISLFLFILNLVTSNGHWWFYWPVLGWGLAVGLNAVKVFAYGSGWEENKAKEILEKEQNKKWQ